MSVQLIIFVCDTQPIRLFKVRYTWCYKCGKLKFTALNAYETFGSNTHKKRNTNKVAHNKAHDMSALCQAVKVFATLRC